MEDVILRELQNIESFGNTSIDDANESIFEEDIEEVEQKPVTIKNSPISDNNNIPKSKATQLKLPKMEREEEEEEDIEYEPLEEEIEPNNNQIDYDQVLKMMEEYKQQEKPTETPKEKEVKKYSGGGLLGNNNTEKAETEPWDFKLRDIGIGVFVGGLVGLSMMGGRSTRNYSYY